jgi:arylsulfatase
VGSTAPNVILICVDQWRGDCLGVAGHPHVQTPYLDALARNGTRFARAYSATPTCVPARVALFTGQAQESHGRVGYDDGVPFEIAHPVSTMPAEFRKAGYHTHAIGKMHVWPPRARIGFDDVELHDGFLHCERAAFRRQFEFFDDYVPWLRRQPGIDRSADYFDHGVHCNSTLGRPWDKPESVHPTTWVGTRATEWLYRRDPTKPFFLYLSFHRPHPPYDPPAWAFDQYLDLPPYEPVSGDWDHHFDSYRRDGDWFVGRMGARALHRARAGYYGLMTQIDHQISRIRETLVDFDVARNTIIAFTSDHGEMLGEHGMFRKGFGYEGSARIPLLICGASTDDSLVRGSVANEVVELRDIMPTLLDLAGLPVPASVDGRSLAPFLRGEQTPWREHLHGEHTQLGQSLQWLTDGRMKYCWASEHGTEELFDLGSDPQERHNLATSDAHADDLRLWRSRLVAALTGREEGYVEDGRLVEGKKPVRILRHARERLAAAGAND